MKEDLESDGEAMMREVPRDEKMFDERQKNVRSLRFETYLSSFHTFSRFSNRHNSSCNEESVGSLAYSVDESSSAQSLLTRKSFVMKDEDMLLTISSSIFFPMANLRQQKSRAEGIFKFTILEGENSLECWIK